MSLSCSLEPRYQRFLRVSLYLGVAALLAVGIVRAAAFLAYAVPEIFAPDQPFHLEGANVYFAWCVEHALPLYPEGTGPSYVVNAMGPCYFWVVGGLGWLIEADVAALYVIGRIVTFLCGLGPAMLVAMYLHRRYGRWPALVGSVFAVGSGTMIGYGVMARPDMLADLLGAAGFFLACRRDRRWLVAAAILLALCCLTKQTAGAWLLAAVLVLMARRATRGRALLLGAAALALAASIVALLAFTSEPAMVRSLLAQAAVTMDRQQQLGVLMLLGERSPEIVLFALMGCGLWIYGRHKDRTLWILAVVGLIIALLTCAKKGSDVNYFVSLRIVEGLAAGTLCAAALTAKRWRLRWASLTAAAALAMLPSTHLAITTATAAGQRRAWLRSEAGCARQRQMEHYLELAQNPNVRLLTDCDRLAVYQGTRAVLLDAYLFRLQVDGGRIDPRELIERLQSRWFHYVILSADPSKTYHDRFFYRLPAQVAEAVETNYRLQSSAAGLFVYLPRRPAE